MERLVSSNPYLKDVYTNSLYQSTFLPVFEKAEIRIKELILSFFLLGKSKYLLRATIAAIIADVATKIPTDLHDKDAYLLGLTRKSELFVRKYYDAQYTAYEAVKEQLMGTIPAGRVAPIIKNPKQLKDLVESNKLWAEAKGYPNVTNYPKELKMRVAQLGAEPVTTYEPGKKPISLWQKAELDVRYESNMQDLQDLRIKNVQFAWTSSHPNASKRCAPWQGKLMALEGHATMSGFRMGKKDGHWVYSLVDIMNQVDKYGYHNNIICGFNCRHRLIPYFKGTVAPTEYTKEQLEHQRKVESKIRELERTIRLKKKDLRLYNELGDKATVKSLKSQIAKLTSYYQTFCEKNGYAWYKYRIDI